MSGVIPNRSSWRDSLPTQRPAPPQENQQVILEILNYCKVKYSIEDSAHKSLVDLVNIIINEKQFYKDMYERTKDQSMGAKMFKDNFSSVAYRSPVNTQSSKKNGLYAPQQQSIKNLQVKLPSGHDFIDSAQPTTDDKARVTQLQSALERCTKEVQTKICELYEAHNTISNLQRELKNAQLTLEAHQKILSKTGTRIIKTHAQPLSTAKKTISSISAYSRSRSIPLSTKFANTEPSKLRSVSRDPVNPKANLLKSLGEKHPNGPIDPSRSRLNKLNIPVKPQNNMLASKRGERAPSPVPLKMKLSNDKRSKRSEMTLSPKSSSRVMFSIAKNPHLNLNSATYIPLTNSKSLDKRKVSSIAPLHKLTDSSTQEPITDKNQVVSMIEIYKDSAQIQIDEEKLKLDELLKQEKKKLELQLSKEKSYRLQQFDKEKAVLIEQKKAERDALIQAFELQKSEIISQCTERENDRIMELKASFVGDMQLVRQKHLLLEDECRLLRQRLFDKKGEEKASQTESELTMTLLSSEIQENGINSVVQEKDYLIDKYRRKMLKNEKKLRTRDKQLSTLKNRLVSELESRSEVFDQLANQINVFESALVTLTSEKKP